MTTQLVNGKSVDKCRNNPENPIFSRAINYSSWIWGMRISPVNGSIMSVSPSSFPSASRAVTRITGQDAPTSIAVSNPFRGTTMSLPVKGCSEELPPYYEYSRVSKHVSCFLFVFVFSSSFFFYCPSVSFLFSAKTELTENTQETGEGRERRRLRRIMTKVITHD
jgi:hypothetical protein